MKVLGFNMKKIFFFLLFIITGVLSSSGIVFAITTYKTYTRDIMDGIRQSIQNIKNDAINIENQNKNVLSCDCKIQVLNGNKFEDDYLRFYQEKKGKDYEIVLDASASISTERIMLGLEMDYLAEKCSLTVAKEDRTMPDYIKTYSCVAKINLDPFGEKIVGKSDISLSVNSLKDRARSLNVSNFKSVPDMIKRAITLLMAFMGCILFALYIYAGLTWMTANGNEERITSAKNILVWSTLGVAVMMASYVIISFIFTSLAVQ